MTLKKLYDIFESVKQGGERCVDFEEAKKRWSDLEKRVANLEKKQSQPLEIDSNHIFDALKKETENQMNRIGKSVFSC